MAAGKLIKMSSRALGPAPPRDRPTHATSACAAGPAVQRAFRRKRVPRCTTVYPARQSAHPPQVRCDPAPRGPALGESLKLRAGPTAPEYCGRKGGGRPSFWDCFLQLSVKAAARRPFAPTERPRPAPPNPSRPALSVEELPSPGARKKLLTCHLSRAGSAGAAGPAHINPAATLLEECRPTALPAGIMPAGNACGPCEPGLPRALERCVKGNARRLVRDWGTS